MSDKRQKNQLALAFTERDRSEAPKASQEGTESFTAKCETERAASHEQLMEEVCERENCWQAYKRVKANKGSPGIDGLKVGELSDYLKQHWPSIREQLLRGTYQPQPVRRVEIPKPDGVVRKLGIPTVLGQATVPPMADTVFLQASSAPSVSSAPSSSRKGGHLASPFCNVS
jgi:RNA-directed DNA polymerase